ncbi:MAG: hypothetical protein K2P81_04365 [Bacteriovoracaceae bacterium]|nr:hypothetical protein [Bacteriovoracaceae bacterium]
MKVFKLKRKTLAIMSVAFVAIGTYNSIVVNSDSFMDSQGIRFVKRLDELNGEFKSGRKLANNGEWIKLRSPIKKLKSPLQKDLVAVSFAAPTASSVEKSDVASAAIQEDLSLELSEVFNAKKYTTALKPGDFSGTLNARDGVIESISVSLPNSEAVAISFSEMAGNVFEYEHNGEMLSGMMYQMDKTSYMVTLTNGPFEGTRLKFTSPVVSEENFGNNAAEVAENNSELQAEVIEQPEPEFAAVINDDGSQLEVGSFGVESQAETTDVAQIEPTPAPEGGYGFNF